MLESYIYRNLERYGNCIIGMQDIENYGEANIIKDLKKHEFKCSLRIVGEYREINDPNIGKYNDACGILEVIK
jgi:hypothetical protein